MERDYLWRNVEASVGPYFMGWKSEEFHDETYTEFLIEVRDRGQVVYQRTIISDTELEDYPGLYKQILDNTVKLLDKWLEEHGHRNPISRKEQ